MLTTCARSVIVDFGFFKREIKILSRVLFIITLCLSYKVPVIFLKVYHRTCDFVNYYDYYNKY
jgi:hypothetical protein